MESATNGACGRCAGAHDSNVAADGIGRRTFLAQSALLAAGALLAAACGSEIATAPTTVSPTTLRVSDYPALATVGGIALVTISGSPFYMVAQPYIKGYVYNAEFEVHFDNVWLDK